MWIWVTAWAVLLIVALLFIRGAHVDDPFGDA